MGFQSGEFAGWSILVIPCMLLEKIDDYSEEGLVNMESTIPDSIPVSLMQKHKNQWSEF